MREEFVKGYAEIRQKSRILEVVVTVIADF